MYQETSLFPQMTILENMYLNHEVTRKWAGVIPLIDYRSMRKRVEDIFMMLNVCIDLNAKVKDIAMAQKQVVEIAKALTFDSKILIMDEPTSSLTQKEVDALFEIIRKLRQQGVAIAYISHRLEEIFEICDRVTVIRDGKFISCSNVRDTNKDKIVAEMVGRPVGQYYPKETVEIGETVLDVKNVSQGRTVKNASLEVRKSEIVGLAGLAGAGRTELALAICGLLPMSGGEVFLEGRKVNIKSYKNAMTHGIVYVSEDRGKYGLVLRMSIEQNVTLPQLKQLSRAMFVDRNREASISDNVIDKFSIVPNAREFIVDNLSGGNQQKVAVAKAVALSPKVMILDEPTRGVDVNAKAEIHRLIGGLVKEGLSILMISSELPELLGMCDRVFVMRKGEIVSCFDRSEASQEKILKDALSET